MIEADENLPGFLMRLLIILAALLSAGCATPPEGAGIFGGSKATKVSEARYVVTASINGYTHPAALKGFVARRAQAVALADGYASFRIRGAEIPPTVDGWHVVAAVELSKEENLVDSQAYRVGPGDTPRPTPFGNELNPQALALLKGSSSRTGLFSWETFYPIFVDTVAIEHNAFTISGGLENASVQVPSGEQVIVVETRLNRSGGNGPWSHLIPIRATLAAGSSYRVAGSVDGDRLAVWIEDVTTRDLVGQKVEIQYTAPSTRVVPLR